MCRSTFVSLAAVALMQLLVATVCHAQVTNCGVQPSTINFLGSLDGRRLGFYMANSFQTYCPLTTIDVTVTSFTAGGGGLSIPAVEGVCTDQDIGAMSRPWRDSEGVDAEEPYIYQCEIADTSRSAVQIDVAMGALVVVVRKGTMADACLAKLPGLTMAQLRAVFSSRPSGTLPTFADLDPSCPATTIKITGPQLTSDAAVLLRNVVGFTSYDARYKSLVDDSEATIGVISLSLFLLGEDSSNVRGIRIQNENGRFVAPTRAEIGTVHNDRKTTDLGHNHDKGKASEYPFAYRIYFNLYQETLAKTKPFMEYVLSDAGTSAIAVNGLVPMPPAERAVMRNRIGIGFQTGTVICFPGSVTVEVHGKGVVQLSELHIGDAVKVSENKFDTVYSFGHYDADVIVDQYLAIHAGGLEVPLEISPKHLVFTKASPGAIPASKVQVGDELRLGAAHGAATATVTKIEKVTRRGAFAPFTYSGSVVVNGFVTSNYVSMDEENAILSANAHWLAHLIVSPRRLLCLHAFERCSRERHNAEGIATWVAPFHKASEWLVDQHAVVLTGCLFPLLLVVAMIAGMFESTATILLVTIGGVAIMRRRRKYTKSVA